MMNPAAASARHPGASSSRLTPRQGAPHSQGAPGAPTADVAGDGGPSGASGERRKLPFVALSDIIRKQHIKSKVSGPSWAVGKGPNTTGQGAPLPIPVCS